MIEKIFFSKKKSIKYFDREGEVGHEKITDMVDQQTEIFSSYWGFNKNVYTYTLKDGDITMTSEIYMDLVIQFMEDIASHFKLFVTIPKLIRGILGLHIEDLIEIINFRLYGKAANTIIEKNGLGTSFMRPGRGHKAQPLSTEQKSVNINIVKKVNSVIARFLRLSFLNDMFEKYFEKIERHLFLVMGRSENVAVGDYIEKMEELRRDR